MSMIRKISRCGNYQLRIYNYGDQGIDIDLYSESGKEYSGSNGDPEVFDEDPEVESFKHFDWEMHVGHGETLEICPTIVEKLFNSIDLSILPWIDNKIRTIRDDR